MTNSTITSVERSNRNLNKNRFNWRRMLAILFLIFLDMRLVLKWSVNWNRFSNPKTEDKQKQIFIHFKWNRITIIIGSNFILLYSFANQNRKFSKQSNGKSVNRFTFILVILLICAISHRKMLHLLLKINW